MITQVRPLVKNIMRGLGFEEWTKSFDPSNLPKTSKEYFHLKTEGVALNAQNQVAIDLAVSIQIAFLVKAKRDESSAFEAYEEKIQSIISQMCSPQSRTHFPQVKSIRFVSSTAESAIGNDNSVLGLASFQARVFL